MPPSPHPPVDLVSPPPSSPPPSSPPPQAHLPPTAPLQQQQQQQQQQQHPSSSTPTTDPAALYEQVHVHQVYSQIAPHFSATRHKPWPRVSRFLLSRPPGALGLDVGCGNGKYLSVNRDVYLVGSDRSEELVRLARRDPAVIPQPDEGDDGAAGGREVMAADQLALPFRDGVADFVLCIAVVHHFSTRERRVEAIRALLRCARPTTRGVRDGGEVLVYVWALEQSSSRRGWDEGAPQDQLVPWVMKQQQQSKKKKGKKGHGREGEEGGQRVEGNEEEAKQEGERTYQRYYHLYRKGELEEDVEAAGGLVLESGYERDNWWVIAANVAS